MTDTRPWLYLTYGLCLAFGMTLPMGLGLRFAIALARASVYIQSMMVMFFLAPFLGVELVRG